MWLDLLLLAVVLLLVLLILRAVVGALGGSPGGVPSFAGAGALLQDAGDQVIAGMGQGIVDFITQPYDVAKYVWNYFFGGQ